MRAQQKRATVVGLGLIGGSLAAVLGKMGWHVTGVDVDAAAAHAALAQGFIAEEGIDKQADIVFIATPVLSVVAAARRVLSEVDCPVTDVGSVKGPIAGALANEPRFIPGHPMAGNEFTKLEGADAGLFNGSTWILTPGENTDENAYARLHTLITHDFGAKVVSMRPDQHDMMLAAISHVPHLAAAALTQSAVTAAGDFESTMLRLAAGGFRDMTRIASGDPSIWVDVCIQNKEGIVNTFQDLISRLEFYRDVVKDENSEVLRQSLLEAQSSRRGIPSRTSTKLAEIRVPIADRTGVLRDVTTLATDLNVNLVDIEIAHNAEGSSGVLMMLAENAEAERLFGGLKALNFRPALRHLGPSGARPGGAQ